ncbi:unnamed protein product, partial [Polarella glacialis]
AVLPRGPGGMPAFDLLLLGFGPDGHVCSLFPDHPSLGDDSGSWVLPIWDSPKPPAERMTLSMAAVNSASRVILVGAGASKKFIVRDAFAPGGNTNTNNKTTTNNNNSNVSRLPCRRAVGAMPAVARPTWVLDPAAAALLSQNSSEYEMRKL